MNRWNFNGSSRFGGDGESRTRVRKHFHSIFSERSWWINFRRGSRSSADYYHSYPVSPLRLRASPQSFPT